MAFVTDAPYMTGFSSSAELKHNINLFFRSAKEHQDGEAEFLCILSVVYHIVMQGSSRRSSGNTFDQHDIAHTAFLKIYASSVISRDKGNLDLFQKLALVSANDEIFLLNLKKYLMRVICSVQRDLFKGKYVPHDSSVVLKCSHSHEIDQKVSSYDDPLGDSASILDILGNYDSELENMELNLSLLNEYLDRCSDNKILAGILIKCMKAQCYPISELKSDVLHGNYFLINLNLNLMTDMKLVSAENAIAMINAIKASRQMGFYYLQNLAEEYLKE